MFEDEYDNTPTMERLRHKKRLIKDINEELELLSKDKMLYGRHYKWFLRSVLNDGKLGFKNINKKNPVFIEMATLKSVGNGLTKKVSSFKEDSDDEILVNLPNSNVRLSEDE